MELGILSSVLSVVTNTIIFVLSVVTNTIILLYLGTTFESTDALDVNDWKRKWILVIAYFKLIVTFLELVLLISQLIALFIFDTKSTLWDVFYLVFFVISCIFSIVIDIFTIIYLGPTFEKLKIEGNDWKRKWIIFFTLFLLVLQGVLFLFLFLKLIALLL